MSDITTHTSFASAAVFVTDQRDGKTYSVGATGGFPSIQIHTTGEASPTDAPFANLTGEEFCDLIRYGIEKYGRAKGESK